MKKNEKYDIGTIYKNRYGEEFEIIGKSSRYKYRVIRFLDQYQYIAEVNITCIKRTNIKNPYRRSVFGIGYYGEGKDFRGIKCNSKHPLYTIWSKMMDRCYNSKHNRYHIYGAKGVRVCDKWHNFSNFVHDITGMYNGDLLYQSRIIKDYQGIKFALDKDSTKSKLYSEDTVKIIPMTINSGLSNLKDEDKKAKIIQKILEDEKPRSWVCGMDEGIFL